MKSFLSDRTQLKAPAVQAQLADPAKPFAPTAVQAKGKHTASHSGEAHVECIREGDRITRLIITCPCGERTEIDCLYASGK